MSGGVEKERARELVSTRSGLGPLWWASWVNRGWLDAWVGVVGGVENPEAAEEYKVQGGYLSLSLVPLDADLFCAFSIGIVDRVGW